MTLTDHVDGWTLTTVAIGGVTLQVVTAPDGRESKSMPTQLAAELVHEVTLKALRDGWRPKPLREPAN